MPQSSPLKQIRESRPLARTPHHCTVCGLPIAIGTRYQVIIYKDNEALDRNKSLKSVKWHLPICPAGGREHG
jgi:hypothetical protein